MQLFYSIFLFALFLREYAGLTCYKGSQVGPQTTCTANLTLGEQCITAQLHTPGLNTTNGTEIYACGNCSYFQSATTFFYNVSCCNGLDLCQTFGPTLPDPSTCESLNSQSGCIARNDCYWCDSVQAGVGLCKSLNGSKVPCFATSLAMPPTICSAITCTPVVPAYNVTDLTRSFLTTFGLPGLSYPTDVGLALDIMSRQVRILSDNVTYDFCDLDLEFVEWCGINSSNFPTYFKYCVISETWPQNDVYGWLRNTTMTGNAGFNPLYPALCACLTPGRAYYIPTGFLITQAYYAPPCRAEHAMLAFYILLMLVSTIALIYVLYETLFLLQHMWNQSKQKRWSSGKTLVIKVSLVIYFCLTVVDEALWVAPQYNGVTTSVVGLLRLLGIIFFEFTIVFTIFILCGIILKSQLFGENDKYFMNFFSVFKWILLLGHCFCFIALFAFAGATTFYYEAFTSSSIPNLTVFGLYVVNAVALSKTIFSLLPALLAIIEICAALILGYTAYKIRSLFKSREELSKQVKTLIYRIVILGIVFVVLLVWLVFMSLYIYMENYILARSIPSPFTSQYQSHYALQWFLWGMFVVELIVLMLVDLAMRSKIRTSWFFRRVMSHLGFSSFTITDSSSPSSSVQSSTTVDMNTGL
jgi:hypothetical protein